MYWFYDTVNLKGKFEQLCHRQVLILPRPTKCHLSEPPGNMMLQIRPKKIDLLLSVNARIQNFGAHLSFLLQKLRICIFYFQQTFLHLVYLCKFMPKQYTHVQRKYCMHSDTVYSNDVIISIDSTPTKAKKKYFAHAFRMFDNKNISRRINSVAMKR